MITIQGLPDNGCNVFYGSYIDNYRNNTRTRYYLYDGQAIPSSTSTFTTMPNGYVCMTSEPVYNPLLQGLLIIAVIASVIAVFVSAYSIVIKPFIKTKKG